MDAVRADLLANKLTRKITCLIMEEITAQYKDDSEFDNFQLDYEYIKAITVHKLFRLSVNKASSPVGSPSDASRMGINFN